MLSFLAKWRHRSHSLTTRFIALAVSLFAVLQVVQLLSFTESVRTNAAIQQNQGFDLARKVLTSQLSQRQQMLTQSAQVLASDFSSLSHRSRSSTPRPATSCCGGFIFGQSTC